MSLNTPVLVFHLVYICMYTVYDVSSHSSQVTLINVGETAQADVRIILDGHYVFYPELKHTIVTPSSCKTIHIQSSLSTFEQTLRNCCRCCCLMMSASKQFEVALVSAC